jgi:hypothetical protein
MIKVWLVGALICGSLAVGVVLGGKFSHLDLAKDHLDAESFITAAKPALESRQIKDVTALGLALALNPCIIDGPLPAGCEKYVKNGQVTQPPIKIILDTDK